MPRKIFTPSLTASSTAPPDFCSGSGVGGASGRACEGARSSRASPSPRSSAHALGEHQPRGGLEPHLHGPDLLPRLVWILRAGWLHEVQLVPVRDEAQERRAHLLDHLAGHGALGRLGRHDHLVADEPRDFPGRDVVEEGAAGVRDLARRPQHDVFGALRRPHRKGEVPSRRGDRLPLHRHAAACRLLKRSERHGRHEVVPLSDREPDLGRVVPLDRVIPAQRGVRRDRFRVLGIRPIPIRTTPAWRGAARHRDPDRWHVDGLLSCDDLGEVDDDWLPGADVVSAAPVDLHPPLGLLHTLRQLRLPTRRLRRPLRAHEGQRLSHIEAGRNIVPGLGLAGGSLRRAKLEMHGPLGGLASTHHGCHHPHRATRTHAAGGFDAHPVDRDGRSDDLLLLRERWQRKRECERDEHNEEAHGQNPPRRDEPRHTILGRPYRLSRFGASERPKQPYATPRRVRMSMIPLMEDLMGTCGR